MRTTFSQGYGSLFQYHKAPEEKELQRLKIEELRKTVEADNCNVTGAEPAGGASGGRRS